MDGSVSVAWHHSSLTVDDLDEYIAFYQDYVGYEVL